MISFQKEFGVGELPPEKKQKRTPLKLPQNSSNVDCYLMFVCVCVFSGQTSQSAPSWFRSRCSPTTRTAETRTCGRSKSTRRWRRAPSVNSHDAPRSTSWCTALSGDLGGSYPVWSGVRGEEGQWVRLMTLVWSESIRTFQIVLIF